MSTESRPSASEPAARHLPYAPALDGLRAVAVLAVILYHAGLDRLRGGFLGVEVFFVISGYLITSLLLAEWEQRGKVSLKGFWLRRARRLLPALFATLLATLAYSVVFLPNEVASLRKDVLAATFYVTNWYLILDHKSYFESVGRPSLLRHLWSLAVEEQFYLLWPIAFSLAIRRWSRRRLTVAVLVVAAASAALMALLFVPDVDPSRIYYGTDTRATGLLVGVALALVWRPWLRSPHSSPVPEGEASRASSGRVRADRHAEAREPGLARTGLALDAVGLAALAGLVGFGVGLGEYDPFLYQGGFALLALTTAAAIAAAVHPATHLGDWLLGRQPLRWMGLRSYSIYLWHWPVFMLTRPQLDVPLDGLPLLAIRLAATALLAELSYRFVETPVRSGGLGRAWRALRDAQGDRRRQLRLRWAGATSALAACLIALGAAAVRAEPPAPPAYLAVTSINTLGQGAPPLVGVARAEEPPSDLASLGSPAPATPEPVAAPTMEPGAAQPVAPTVSARPEATGPGQAADARAIASSTGAPEAQPAAIATTGPTGRPEPAGKPTPAAGPAGQLATSSGPVSTPAQAPASTGKATIVGDSVVLSAWAAVHEIPNLQVDGAVNRQASQLIEALRQDEAEGYLGSTVVVHIGSNGPLSARQFDEIMQVLGPRRRVIFVNVKVPRPWEGPNNAVIADGVKRYPNASLLDWHAASAGHPEWFRDDGIHTSGPGAKAYASLIAEAIK